MTKELLTKIKELEKKTGKSWLDILHWFRSEEELTNYAEKWGVVLTREQAIEGMKLLETETRILSDSEVNRIAGGFRVDQK